MTTTDQQFRFDGHTWNRPFRVDRLSQALTFGVPLGTWVVQATADSGGPAFITLSPAEVLAAFEITED